MITNIRFRNEGELLVLQVEEGYVFDMRDDSRWRDAKTTDLLEVSTYTLRDVENRLRQIEASINGLTDKVWGED